MLINFSNHPTEQWSATQVKAAEEIYKTIVDVNFPDVNPEINKEQIIQLAQKYVNQIVELKPQAVHIMGEMNFTFVCLTVLKSLKIKCIASTTRRNSTLNANKKTSEFEFVQFREY